MKKQITGKAIIYAMAFMITNISGITFFPFHVFANEENGKGMIAQKVNELKQNDFFKRANESEAFTIVGNNSDVKISETVKNYVLLKTSNNFESILQTRPEYIRLSLPSLTGTGKINLLLYKINNSPDGLTIITSDGKNEHAINDFINYRGIIENDNNSVAAITFSQNETMGMISNKDGNLVLGKLENNKDGLYILYNDKDLVPHSNMDCGTKTSVPVNHIKDIDQGNHNKLSSLKCVNWYWEADYDVYVGKSNSVANVTTYMNGIFNQVSTLYANDGMSINLQTLFIWDTVDPYTGPGTGDFLTQFGTYRTSFAGDLATLVGYLGGGGIAWINGFCNSTSVRMSYCGINSTFQNVPTYSWTVEVIAHEEGHLFGSNHTHDCVWNGNNTKIDACGDVAGYGSGSCPQTIPPLPVAGGTIMSYCHLTSAGINLSLGFGPQPKTLMLNNENNSSCLASCSGCPPPAQPGSISGSASVCQSSTQVYSITAVSGAISYTWTKPNGWTGTSTSNSISLSSSSTNGIITVTANNACGSSSARTLTVTVNALPPIPASITAIGGNTKVCAGDVKTYSINAVSGASSYTWIAPAGATIASGQGSLTATVSFNAGFVANDSIRVAANNSCGMSAKSAILIKRNVPLMPSVISGSNFNTCNLTNVPYAVVSVAGVTYNWLFNTGNATVTSGQGTHAITSSFTSGYSSGQLIVTANNACGAGNARTMYIKSTPPAATIINGATTVCANQQNVPYSITPVAGATSYTWIGPNGSRFSDGITTSTSATLTTILNNVTVNFKTTAGAIKVKANNACGPGSTKSLNVLFTCKEILESANNILDLSIAPNPAHDQMQVSFNLNQKTIYEIHILDLTGRVLFTIKKSNDAGEVKEQIDLTNLAKGFYMLDVITETNRNTQRFIVE